MKDIVKIIVSSLYGVQIRRDIDESYKSNSKHWMKKEYDNNVSDYWKLCCKIEKRLWIPWYK